MTIADNLSENGVWGINEKEFSSSSSSILYPLILAAAFRFAENQLYIPLYSNIFIAVLSLIVLNYFLKFLSIGPGRRTVFLLLTLLIIPLPAMTLLGMEHTLHILLTLIFTWLALRSLTSGNRSVLEHISLIVFTLLFMSIRYESLFFLPFFLIMLLSQKKYSHMMAISVTALLPTIIFGLYSIENGGYFLPNSIIIKSLMDKNQLADYILMPLKAVSNLRGAPHFFTLLVISSFLFFAKNRKQIDFMNKNTLLYGFFVSTALIHLLLARTGWFYRYEAYLIPIGLLATFQNIPDDPVKNAAFLFHDLRLNKLTCSLTILTVLLIPTLNNISLTIVPYSGLISALTIILILIIKSLVPKASYRPVIFYSIIISFLIAPIATRGVISQVRLPIAMKNIYDQQYQMSSFINKYYAGKHVAVNDIGAVSYFGNAYVLDLWGLGNKETLDARRRQEFNTGFIRQIVTDRNVHLLIVYEKWFEKFGGIPKTFVKVATWKISNNIVCNDDTVSFYAPDNARAGTLRSNLIDYETLLPTSVQSKVNPVL
jgi:hypothetical protein